MPVIAIVDDNDPFRHATASFIRSLGYAVLQFASAEAFLKSNRLDDTDCLISDVQMPDMNGIEMQGKLIGQGHHLPIIFVTAFSEMRARAQALAAGAIGFLAKPFSDKEMQPDQRSDSAMADPPRSWSSPRTRPCLLNWGETENSQSNQAPGRRTR